MVVDASVWAGFFIPADVHHPVSRRWLREQYSEHDRRLFGPSLVLAEVAGAVARRTGDSALAATIVTEMLTLPEIEIVPLDEDMAQDAARLAADLRLRGADACYVAVAQALDLPLVTWDEELRDRAGRAVAVVEPE